jgi:hypothetical protein
MAVLADGIGRGEEVESMSTTAKNGGLFYYLLFTVVFSHAVERR